MSILVVAEKPSVARDIARVLGAKNKADGYIYNENYVISWAVGHLVGLSEPEEYDKSLKRWTLSALPIIPDKIKLKVLPSTEKQYLILKQLMTSKNISEIVCATDSGREGELIFRYIYNHSGCSKPFKRLWISSMTDASIKNGFKTLKNGNEYDNLYYSAKCRSEADWLVGINASRAYSLQYNAHLSIGRVQTPTLSLLVANRKAIEQFVPEKYWEVHIVYDTQVPFKAIWFDKKSNDTKIKDHAKAKSILSSIKNQSGIITSTTTEEKKMPPPLLFDLTELQRECNKKYGFSAKKTLDIAQSLYEKHKAITYPRTDSRYIINDMKSGIKKVLSILSTEYGQWTDTILRLENLPFTKRIVDDNKISDHHAIIPTGKKVSSFTKDEQAVFDLIAKRLIAAFYKDYIYAVTKVISKVASEFFLSKGQTVVNLGWREVLGNEKEDSDMLPLLNEGESYTVKQSKIVNKSTSPPKPYTEATLLSAMENAGKLVDDDALKEALKDSGLGTPATRAAIIERLITVGYVLRDKKNLIATDKAVKLIEIVPHELKSPETTAKWERALSQISKGNMATEKFNKSIERYVKYIVQQSYNKNKDIYFERGTTYDKRQKGN